MRTSSIMTTNRNSTMTAPTYTSTRSRDRNSAPSSIQNMEAVKKVRCRCSTQVTGLVAVMTRNAATTGTSANRKRTEERRDGKEWERTWKTRWATTHIKKK